MWTDGDKDASPLTEVRGANFEGVAPQESGAGRGRSIKCAMMPGGVRRMKGLDGGLALTWCRAVDNALPGGQALT